MVLIALVRDQEADFIAYAATQAGRLTFGTSQHI
jgi:hypothetical protein